MSSLSLTFTSHLALPAVAVGGKAFWYLTRATGIVALLLLTAVVVLGVVSASGFDGSPRWPRFAVGTLHRDLSLLVIVVLVIHILTTVLDGFAPISLIDAIIPLHSAYRPIWLGFGALAFDLVIALTVTSYFRRRLGYSAWRAIHWLAYVSWPVAVLHGLGTGSDSKETWALAITLACVIAVVGAVIFRVARTAGMSDGARTLAIGGALATVLALAAFAVVGPLAPHWSERAGTPEKILAEFAPPRTAVSVVRPAPRSNEPTLTVPFGATLSGTVNQHQALAGALVDLNMQVRGAHHGELRIRLAGAPDGGGLSMTGSQVDLLLDGYPVVWQGTVTQLQGDALAARVAGGAPSPLNLIINLNIDNAAGTVTGTLRVGGAQ